MAESSDLARAVGVGACAELDSAMRKIDHCLRQLDDDQVWARPAETMNSIANLLLHLAGNLRQWIIAGVGGAADVRQRQQEFDDRSQTPTNQLFEQLQKTVNEALDVMANTSADDLQRVRRVQEFDVTGAHAIFGSVAHFRGHSQEIVHMTRRLLGEQYEFDFVPKE